MAEDSLDVIEAVKRTCPRLQRVWTRHCRSASAGHDRRVGTGLYTLLAKKAVTDIEVSFAADSDIWVPMMAIRKEF
jgi:hypothetical protein